MGAEKRSLKKVKLMTNLNVVILVGFNDIDNFLNCKILENYSGSKIAVYKSAISALSHLTKTNNKYKAVMVDIYMPLMDGFEFIDKFHELQLHKKHGSIYLLSASLDPAHKKKSIEKNVRFIEKPLTIEKLFMCRPSL
jgi:CheY-like chemotaxis protein